MLKIYAYYNVRCGKNRNITRLIIYDFVDRKFDLSGIKKPT